jgi:hypothetical protein
MITDRRVYGPNQCMISEFAPMCPQGTGDPLGRSAKNVYLTMAYWHTGIDKPGPALGIGFELSLSVLLGAKRGGARRCLSGLINRGL